MSFESDNLGVTSVTSANTDISVATTTTTPVLTLNSGTTANKILKLNASAQIPAVSGALLTNLPASASIDQQGSATQTADQSTATTATWVDITNPASVTLNTTATCTIFAMAQVPHQSDGANVINFRLMIDGTGQQPTIRSSATTIDTVTCIGSKSGVASGAIVIKLQMRTNAGTATCDYSATANEDYGAKILAWAIKE